MALLSLRDRCRRFCQTGVKATMALVGLILLGQIAIALGEELAPSLNAVVPFGLEIQTMDLQNAATMTAPAAGTGAAMTGPHAFHAMTAAQWNHRLGVAPRETRRSPEFGQPTSVF